MKRNHAKREARLFFDTLDSSERGDIADALVLGCFDWRDWFEEKPSAEFIRALDAELRYWEETL